MISFFFNLQAGDRLFFGCGGDFLLLFFFPREREGSNSGASKNQSSKATVRSDHFLSEVGEGCTMVAWPQKKKYEALAT